MRRLFYVCGLVVILILTTVSIVHQVSHEQELNREQAPKASPIAPTPTQALVRSSGIFVPYWTDWKAENTGLSSYDEYVYFGVVPGDTGLNTSEAGYAHLSDFQAAVTQGKPKWLTIRMTNSAKSLEILRDQQSWSTLYHASIQAAKQYGFSGILVDLEVSSAPFQNIQDTITVFHANFAQEARAFGLQYGVAVYGDTLYRHRPYDIEALGKSADRVFVMAYDLHKPQGEPGPNFPLSGQDQYGYDLKTMLSDFRGIPKDKLTVIFGMYGYNWIVDETKKPIRTATSQPLNGITKQFIDSCNWKNCVVTRDPMSAETEVDYIDEYDNYRVIWFEDKQSAKQKQDYLYQEGIHRFSYWVWGYFN